MALGRVGGLGRFASALDLRNFRGLTRKLTDLIDSVDKIGFLGVSNVADFIAEEAKKRCPRDTGALEDNIRVVKEGKNKLFVINDIKSKDGFSYARYLHENRHWKLGPESQRKQAGQSEKVGPKWLERAYTENKNKVRFLFFDSASREFKKSIKSRLIVR